MSEQREPRVWLNRIVGFLAGGLLTLAVVSLVIVGPTRSDNESLAKQLDEMQNGAALLLSEARVQLASQSYSRAATTLNTLFEKQPGSSEAIEGRIMYADIEAIVLALDQDWAAAVDAIRSEWEAARSAELRAKMEQDRLLMEATLIDTLQREWDKSSVKVRQEWESREM